MIGTLPAECLLAVTGLFPSRGPSDTQKRLAARFPKRLAARVRVFLESDKPGKFQPLELPDQKAFHEQLLEKVDPDQFEESFLPEEAALSMQYVMLLQAARDKVVAAWPLYPDTGLGFRNYDLAKDELLDVLHVFQTLDSVESVLDDLDARVLLPDQVALLSQVFPDLYETLHLATLEELAPYLEIQGGVEARGELSQVHEEQLRILLQLPADAPLQSAQQPALQAKPGQRQGAHDTTEDEEEHSLETPSEHTAASRVAK
jgi:hypothetical protein